MTIPRIAFCTDTFEEPNGVATIARQFAAFAKCHDYPFLLVRPGERCRTYADGSVNVIEVERSSLCVPLDMGLRFDLRISRHFPWLRERMGAFDPDLVHITGPGDIGMLCSRLSHVLRVPKPPLVASWHTNLHQYARLRLTPVLRLLPERMGASLGEKVERGALRAAARFYQTARLTLAPNQEILSQITSLTGRPGCVMPHAVDTDLFAPEPGRPPGPLTVGYVGRLTPEKNVRFLARVAAGLPKELAGRVRFLIVGDGSERSWLMENLPPAQFTGVLRGQDLAHAYACMDLFLFPSRSDTFGLVVLEAMAAGVPVVAFRLPGPRSAVEDGCTGFTADCPDDFLSDVVQLLQDAELRQRLGRASRRSAERFHWSTVFHALYNAYQTVLPACKEAVRIA